MNARQGTTDFCSHLPQDRVRALANGTTLPDRTRGTVLFADISGFTALTDLLRTAHGPRRGAEELTSHLDALFLGLIAEIDNYGGSVIGFAGDAVTCWFDAAEGQPAARAVACAFALQTAMPRFSTIHLPNGAEAVMSLKVALASGSARRLAVGDPRIRILDTLAGATVARSAAGEKLARNGDVIADAATVAACTALLSVVGWRSEAGGGERFAVVAPAGDLAHSDSLRRPQPRVECTDGQLRDWILKPLLDRTHAFPTQFRPCTALFVRFQGIDYESDAAESHLNAWLRGIQRHTHRFDGTLLQLTIGDKGSYAYINLGAVSAHEDDARRGVALALQLRDEAASLGFLDPLQIGVNSGTLCVGAYGGKTRRTFDALGDGVNLAARLMEAAGPGEILVSARIRKETGDAFIVQPRPALHVKGRHEPIAPFAVIGERLHEPARLQAPTYVLPIVGRAEELRIIDANLQTVVAGRAQTISIVAEPGLGKSRLIAEAIQMADRRGFACYGSSCQSEAANTPYQAWKAIWQAYFALDPVATPSERRQRLEDEIMRRAPDRINALPLLGVLTNLDLADNEFTQGLEPDYRQSALHSLLEACLRHAADDGPLLIVIDDLHWIDELSLDLLETLAAAMADSPVCFVVAYRPPQSTQSVTARLATLTDFTEIQLRELNTAAAGEAIRARLRMLYPSHAGDVPASLIDKLMARAQGNPFYLEELLNYLHDQALDPYAPDSLDRIDLPESLHALVLSRIDQLGEREKTTLRAASIIGRLFRADWLAGYYTELGDLAALQPHLERLQAADITLPAASEPGLAYLFKHIVTYEVTYESLAFATRVGLHGRLAHYLEMQVAAGSMNEAAVLDALVYHLAHTDMHDKERHYLTRASAAALRISAFAAARDYLTRLLELTPVSDPGRSELLRRLGDVLSRLGNYSAADSVLEHALAAAVTDAERAATRTLMAQIAFHKGDYFAAQSILFEAVPLARASADARILCRTLSALGRVDWRLGNMDGVVAAFEESLTLARRVGDSARELAALNGLGVAYLHTDAAKAEQLLSEVLQRAGTIGNRERVMIALGNLGVLEDERANDAAARDYHERSLAIARELGAQYYIAHSLSNLAKSEIALGEFRRARAHTHEALALAQRIGTDYVTIQALCNSVEIAYALGRRQWALALLGLMRRHPAWSNEDTRWLEALLDTWALDPAEAEAGMARGQSLEWAATIQALLDDNEKS